MDAIVKKAQAVNMGEDDIMRITEGKCRVVAYKDLAQCRNIDEALGDDGAIVCLIETTEPNRGHWIAILRTGEGAYEWFDSYGIRVDSELKFVDESKISSQQGPLISRLMENTNSTLVWNHYPLQSTAAGIDTCGRWAGMRIRKRNLTLRQFQECFANQKESPDWLITCLTLEL